MNYCTVTVVGAASLLYCELSGAIGDQLPLGQCADILAYDSRALSSTAQTYRRSMLMVRSFLSEGGIEMDSLSVMVTPRAISLLRSMRIDPLDP
ncbi:hypothetical protein SE91_16215 [Bradyrhizobium sp. DOA1]|nr:hypothetical protein SE91_16215 [Bradyrhizobium sp. DOA1]